MVVTIASKRHWLWRAVDDEGEVLDILVQSRRDTQAAVRLPRKLIRKQGFAPELLVNDRLGPTAPPGAGSVSWPAMSGASVETTGPRSRISRHDGESARCSGSSRRDRHNGFCPPMLPACRSRAWRTMRCWIRTGRTEEIFTVALQEILVGIAPVGHLVVVVAPRDSVHPSGGIWGGSDGVIDQAAAGVRCCGSSGWRKQVRFILAAQR